MNISDILTKDECKTILENVFPNEQYHVLKYYFEAIENLVEGFLSSSNKLIIEYAAADSQEKKSTFFVKTLPKGNDFHEKYVLSTGGFEKEVFFFETIKPNLDLWCKREVIPKCYFAALNRIIVLELITDGNVKDISEYFTLEELKASIASLAVIHSASMMCESKNGLDLISVWGDYFYDALHIRKEGHMGFSHTTNGVKAIKAIIQTKYPELNNDIKKRIFDIFDLLPEWVLASKKYRNVISHGDLYTNNIMLSKRLDQVSARIIDFQLFRFNPPALDLLMLIYLTYDLNQPDELQEIVDYYYQEISDNLSNFGFEVAAELPKQEFNESINHYKPLAIAVTLLYQHYVNLPPNVLNIIMNNPDQLRKFYLEDRLEVVLSSFEFDANYRNKLSTTISQLINSFE